MGANPKEADNPRRAQLLLVLEVLESDLRKLASGKRNKGWYLSIGKILHKAEQVYHGLGTVGFLTEGRELHGHRNRVLEAVAPLVMPHVSQGAPPEICEMISKLGTTPSAQSTRASTSTFIKAIQEMADHAAKVRSYLMNREQATKWGIAAYDVHEREDADSKASGDHPRRPVLLRGSVDPLEVADIAQRTATLIQRVPYLMNELVEADPWPEPGVARERLDPARISIDFMPVALYIERNWTPEHAKKIVSQVHKVTDTVDDFLRSFESIVTTHARESLAWRREDGGVFFVLCTMVANEVAQWAAEIRDRARLRTSALKDPATTAKDVISSSAHRAWVPPLGYVGRKTICNDARFRKGGKNPPLTTIDVWVKAAEREGNPVKIEKAPDNGENHYPEAWIVEQIRNWNPRANKRNPST